MSLQLNISQQRLLQESTIKLKTSKSFGTGFFVAPGFALTCKHVIGNIDTQYNQIQAIWDKRVFDSEVLYYSSQLDIALLSIPITHHPCVLFDHSEVQVGAQLQAYGYPNSERDGDSISPIAEGLSDRGELLTLKQANIREGFSGSPLLNWSTNRICGMITEARRKKHLIANNELIEPIGGQAIPSQVIISQWPTIIKHQTAVDILIKLQAIGALGNLVTLKDRNDVAVFPWIRDDITSVFDVESIIPKVFRWANNLHFSFLNLGPDEIRTTMSNIASFVGRRLDLSYFNVKQNDLRFKIIQEFAKTNYRESANFEQCVCFFLFICTGEQIFLEIIKAQLVKQRFLNHMYLFLLKALEGVHAL